MIDTFGPDNDDGNLGTGGTAELSELFADAATLRVDSGSTLVEAGQLPQHGLFLQSGLVRVSWPVSQHRSLLRGIIGAPGLVDTGILAPSTTSACCSIALTSAVVLVVERQRLTDWLGSHPTLALHLLRQSIAAERLFVERLRQQQLMLPERLNDLLKSYLAAYRHAGHDDGVELPLTNEVIAADLGVVARSVSAALAGLQRNGVVRRTMRGLVIEQPDALSGQASMFLGPGWWGQAIAESVTAARSGSLSVVGEEEVSHEVGRELRIGRAPECRVRILSDEVAPRHCRVFRATTSDRFWVEDLRGGGSVRVNDRPITRAVLSDGDVICIGKHRIVFSESAAIRS